MKQFILVVFFPLMTYAQHQERKVIIFNMGFGGLTSGVGMVINKKANENWKKCFLRGFWQGSIGGLLNYSGKKTAGLINQEKNFTYAIPARLLSSAGNSIIQNAAANEPFLRNWSLEWGMFRLDYTPSTEKKVRVRLLPVAVIGTFMVLPKGKFDLNTTLLSGVMSFQSKDMVTASRSQHDGVNYGRAFVYLDSSTKYHIVTHEIIHEYQYREHMVFNAWLKRTAGKIKNGGLKKNLSKYIYPDIPYFGIAYLLEDESQGSRFFKNYFEFEAERFTTNRYIRIE